MSSSEMQATASLTVDLPSNRGSAEAFWEVRNLNNVVLGRGLTGRALPIPPGTYFVSARDIDGTSFVAAEGLVEVAAGAKKTVVLEPIGSPTRSGQASVEQVVPTAPRGRWQAARQIAPPGSVMMADDGDPATAARSTPERIRMAVLPTRDPLLALLDRNLSPQAPTDAGIHTGAEQIRITFGSSEVVEITQSGGKAEDRKRYRVPVPVDRTGATTLVIAHASQVQDPELRLAATESRVPSGADRFDFDIDLEFADAKLQRFWKLITSAAFEEAWAESDAMAPELMQTGEDWAGEKLSSPVGATLGAYVLLRANRLEQLEPWSANLVRWFPDSADALVIRAELLARLGEHSEAALLLSSLTKVGCPWIRSGIQYAWRLTSTYSAERNHDKLRSLEDTTIVALEDLRGPLARLNGNADPGQLNTVIHWHFPEK
ncbi:MAG: hypothetical protein AB7H90_20120 [Alphaproteobacteria bacterium]